MYCGWQIQPNGVSVQEEIEKALAVILRQKVNVIGAGRTDAGVHALGQVAHFHADDVTLPLETLKRSLNGLLKDGVTIHRVRRVAETFHARYSAKERSYVYSISLRKRSIDRNRFSFFPFPLDSDLMKKAARHLKGRHDFKDVSVATGEKSTLCDIKRLDILKGTGVVTIRITANRFLHKMVRMITGLLINVGRGKIRPEEVKKAFKPGSGLKKMAFCAPAQGLCLVRVSYK
jgi:tRNA pseudouridine38-40 synthase